MAREYSCSLEACQDERVEDCGSFAWFGVGGGGPGPQPCGGNGGGQEEGGGKEEERGGGRGIRGVEEKIRQIQSQWWKDWKAKKEKERQQRVSIEVNEEVVEEPAEVVADMLTPIGWTRC